MLRAISERLACIEPRTLFVGVDVSLDDSVADLLDGRAKQLDRLCKPPGLAVRRLQGLASALLPRISSSP
jgi:hypothetical protein